MNASYQEAVKLCWVVVHNPGIGEPRPTEKELETLVRYPGKTAYQYLKKLGIPVAYCDYESAKLFPELLDMIKDPSKYDWSWPGRVDVTTTKLIHPSKYLLSHIAEKHPDLIPYAKRLVIEQKYIELFSQYGVRPEEINIEEIFGFTDMDHIIEYIRDSKIPMNVFYPIFIRREWKQIDFCFCPEFLQYCIDHWTEVCSDLRYNLLQHIPKDDLAVRI